MKKIKTDMKTYGFPLYFRPENTRTYEEKATTICNGTRAGFTTGIVQIGGADLETISLETFHCTTEEEKTMPLKARDYKDVHSVLKAEERRMDAIVRRLTPLECTRLQGFPDGWVDIGDWTDTKGKLHKEADTPKYKALGNSVAQPYWFWLLRRVSAQYERPATMGSLFSGIGGFDYAWCRCNGSNSVRWSSEIEEFPIAVMKKHFGDEDTGIKGDIQNYL